MNAPGGDSCDFTITVMTQPWFSHICRYIPNLNYIKLGIRSDCVYLPASHPLAQADAQALTLKDFRDETFFVLKDFEVDVDDGPTVKTFAKHGFKPHLKSADSISELIINVEQNKGVCIGSNRLLLRDNPHFVKKYLPELGQHTEVLLWSEDNTNPCIRRSLCPPNSIWPPALNFWSGIPSFPEVLILRTSHIEQQPPTAHAVGGCTVIMQ